MRAALSITFLCWAALASPLRAIDGDTFVADARIWPGLISRAPKIEDFKVMQSQVGSIWEWFTTNLERRRTEDR